MDIERRGFFGTALALGAGAVALTKVNTAHAKGLPSDPGSETSAGPDEITLPSFEKNHPCTLDHALLNRKTDRKYDKGAVVSPDQLSRILWACNGVNRPDGHRTTPSAVASYPVEVYAAIAEGVYRYDLKRHILVKVIGEDIRDQIPAQPGLKKAALKLLYIVDPKKNRMEMTWADLEIGCMVQSVYLEAACLGLGSTVFAIVRYQKVEEALGLQGDLKVRIAQAVGPIRG
jgi:nitroreductase